MYFLLLFYRVSMGHGGKPWVSNINDPNYVAGRKAMKTGNYEYSYVSTGQV
jgi:hypothetical protein